MTRRSSISKCVGPLVWIVAPGQYREGERILEPGYEERWRRNKETMQAGSLIVYTDTGGHTGPTVPCRIVCTGGQGEDCRIVNFILNRSGNIALSPYSQQNT